MQTGNSVIIHKSAIIQQGLKSILLSRNIGICDILNEIPDCAILSNWKNFLLLVDTLYANEISKHLRILQKNGTTVIGIGTNGFLSEPVFCFDDVIDINENTELILQRISGYVLRVSGIKPNNQLSPRETEILSLVAQGFSNKQIAEHNFISIHTVITHRKNITYKFGIKSISGLTLYAALNNLVDTHR